MLARAADLWVGSSVSQRLCVDGADGRGVWAKMTTHNAPFAMRRRSTRASSSIVSPRTMSAALNPHARTLIVRVEVSPPGAAYPEEHMSSRLLGRTVLE